MKKSTLVFKSFLSSLGMFAYVILVLGFINQAENWFGSADNFWGSVLLLTLFVFSALISGLLILGYPIWLYLEQKKKEAVFVLLCNVGWLLGILIVAGVIMAINF